MLQSNYRNRLLRAMPAEPFAALQTELQPVELPRNFTIEDPDHLIERVCFPETGIVSVVAVSNGERQTEIGLIGFEGATGSAVLTGADRTANHTYVQAAGAGHLVAADRLRALLQRFPTLHAVMLRYLHTFHIQVSQTALANSRGVIDQRLARWLLMAGDRVGDASMPLTHDLLSVMLGVRRPGVTDSLHRLEGLHLIRASRASIVIRDRTRLAALADGFYGIPEREYERVLGQDAPPTSRR